MGLLVLFLGRHGNRTVCSEDTELERSLKDGGVSRLDSDPKSGLLMGGRLGQHILVGLAVELPDRREKRRDDGADDDSDGAKERQPTEGSK